MAEWTTAYVNDLPDSAFLYIEPGGTKDSEGKTMPRSKRHFPVRDANGKVDDAHVANALGRIPQASSLSAGARATAMTKAKALAKNTTVSGGKGTYAGSAGSGRSQPGGNVMSDLLIRAYASEIGSLDRLDEGILDCRLVPFNMPTRVTDVLADGSVDSYVEEIAPTMFSQQVRGHLQSIQRIKFYDGHPAPGLPAIKLGWTTALRSADDGVYGTLHVQSSQRADVREMIANGIRDLSVGFAPSAGGTIMREDGSRLRVRGYLDHIALEPEGAYPGAEVLAMRAKVMEEEDAAAEREAERLERGDLDRWLAEMDKSQATFSARARGMVVD